ncbi:MAG: DUF6132 family protein [Bacteroidales bacterium]|jgi:hypothetical protein
MKNLIKKYRVMILGVIIGIIGGFLYWKFIGCSSGTCPITSSPINSTVFGAIIGGLMFSPNKNKKQKENEDSN